MMFIATYRCHPIRHGEAPTTDQTRSFVSLCQNFINKNPTDMIAVHCTHGFNRTGFLICAFLCEDLHWDISAAVLAFSVQRSPGIYKDDYIKELYRRYDELENATPAPILPDWCFEEEEADDDDKGDEGFNDPRRRRREFQKVNPTFMEGVEGVTVVSLPQKISSIQALAQDMCGWSRPGFPGSQPVSMSRSNIPFLHHKNYKVSWKADGTRYLMLILKENEVYFIDRDNAIFQCSGIKFPRRKNPTEHTCNTLVDGEMVLDEVDGQKIPRYLIYDIIKYENEDVGGCDFDRRMLCINRELIGPRELAKKEGRIDRSSEPFSVRIKFFWDIIATHTFFEEKFTKNVGHEIDGLIFQPVPDPYKPGRCMESLKWKPPSLNSVDFKLVVGKDERPGMLQQWIGYLYVGGQSNFFATMKMNKALREYDKKIIECTWDFDLQQWKFLRVRNDKSFPNSFDTAMGVWDSIKAPIHRSDLLEFIEKHRWQAPIVHNNHNHKRPPNDRNLMPPPKVPRNA